MCSSADSISQQPSLRREINTQRNGKVAFQLRRVCIQTEIYILNIVPACSGSVHKMLCEPCILPEGAGRKQAPNVQRSEVGAGRTAKDGGERNTGGKCSAVASSLLSEKSDD